MKVREFKRQWDLNGEKATLEGFKVLLKRHRDGESGGINPADISLRDLYEEFYGREALDSLRPGRGPLTEEGVMEADAVNSTAFANITGQIVYSAVLEAYESEEFLASRMIGTTQTPFLDGEKIPGMSRIGDEAEVVGEGEQYPHVGFGDEYIQTPRTVKRGMICSVTKEAVFADRISRVLTNAAEVGHFLGLNKEKRLIDLLIGQTNNYERNGTASDTYQTSTPWINDQSNELVDWTDVENSWLLLREMTDPNTGEPINVMGTNLIVAPAKRFTLARILNATEVRHGSDPITISANPINGLGLSQAGDSELMRSRIESELGVSAANSEKYWFHGDFQKAFTYMEAFPLETMRNTDDSASFNRDIVAEFKSSERGVPAVLDPRHVVRNKN